RPRFSTTSGGSNFPPSAVPVVSCVTPLLLAGDVFADPLLGNLGQRAVGLHFLEDFLDLGIPFRIALFGCNPDRLVEQLALDDLELAARILDTLPGGQVAGDDSVEPLAGAQRQILESSVFRIVRNPGDVIEGELDVLRVPVRRLDHQLLVDVFLESGAGFGANLLAAQVGSALDVGVVAVDHDHGGCRVILVDEVEHLAALGGRRHRADADIPAALPVAGRDDRPGRRLDLVVYAQPLGEFLR